MSKIHSESKSQRGGGNGAQHVNCVSLCQRYILKANHNRYTVHHSTYRTVSHYVKDTFWKQITTATLNRFINTNCVSLCQRYILKANHNTEVDKQKLLQTVSHYVKDTFWKQITTSAKFSLRRRLLCLTMSKIHSESKSQQLHSGSSGNSYCVSLCQRYILKANHNLLGAKKPPKVVIFRQKLTEHLRVVKKYRQVVEENP